MLEKERVAYLDTEESEGEATHGAHLLLMWQEGKSFAGWKEIFHVILDANTTVPDGSMRIGSD